MQRSMAALQAGFETKKNGNSAQAVTQLQMRIEDLQRQAEAAAAAHRQQVCTQSLLTLDIEHANDPN